MIEKIEGKEDAYEFSLKEFEEITTKYEFYKKVLSFDLIIPNFNSFQFAFERAFNEIVNDPKQEYQGGEVASYIPPLALANPEWLASSFCSANG